MMTMGQAVDAAIKRHEECYPGSKDYHADVREGEGNEQSIITYRVELRADHFSCPLVYYVPIA